MVRVLFIAICIAIAVFIRPAASFGDEDLDNPNLRVSEGRVISVDRSGQSITVDAGMPMKFFVSSDTKLHSEATTYQEDIKLSDINPGDDVTVEYIRKGEDSRVPEKTVKITVENKVRGNN